MRTSWVFLAALAAASCIGDLPARPCDRDDQCVRAGDRGQCRPSPVSGESYCVFAGGGCPNGHWGELAGDDLALTCWNPAATFDGALAFDAPVTTTPDGATDAPVAVDADPGAPDAEPAMIDAAVPTPPDAPPSTIDAAVYDAPPPSSPDATITFDAPPPTTPDARPDAPPPTPDAKTTGILQVTVSGSGSIQFDPPGAPCGANCAAFPFGTSVLVIPQPDAQKRFAQWSGGGCSAFAATCTVSVSSDVTLSARFEGGAEVYQKQSIGYRILAAVGTSDGRRFEMGIIDQPTDLGDGETIDPATDGNYYTLLLDQNNAIVWKHVFSASLALPRGAATSDGGAVFAGTFRNTANFGTGPMLTAGTFGSIFVIKYTSSGSGGWAIALTDDSELGFEDVAVAGDGSTVTISGLFLDDVTFGSLPELVGRGGGNADWFVLRMVGATPIPSYARAFTEDVTSIRIAQAPNGWTGVGVNFKGTMNVGGTNYVSMQRDVLALRVSPSSDAQIVYHAAEAADISPNHIMGVAFDSLSAMYIGFGFTAALNLGDGVRTPQGSDVLVAKFDTNKTLLWTRQFGGTGNETPDGLFARDQNVYVSIDTSATGFQIEGWQVDVRSEANLVKLSSGGNYQWGQAVSNRFTTTLIPAANGRVISLTNTQLLKVLSP